MTLACVVISVGSPPRLADAVQSLLNQDCPVEILVVNSGGGWPTETLGEAAARVRIVNVEDQLSAGAARNIGVAQTRAPFVAFLAADCVAEPGWVSARLKRHAGGALAVSSAITNPTPDNFSACASQALVFARHYGVSYARTLFDRFGRFREDLRSGEDTDFNGRLSGTVPIEWAPEVRTAHQHPTTVVSLARDQYRRGNGRAIANLQTTGRTRRWRELRKVGAGALQSMKLAWTASPWIVLAACADALGVLSASSRGVSNPYAVAPTSQPPRIIALLAFRDEMAYLPGYFANVAPHVDGIVALDDGSVDGSGDFVAAQSGVLELIRLPPRNDHEWDEPRNQRLLIEAALRHQPDWLLAHDADQRLERDFRRRALRAIARADREGHRAYAYRFLELWDRPDTYRDDGVWGRKRMASLFRARTDHLFNDRALHGTWAPADARENGAFPHADLIVYHLRMIDPEDRRKRHERYVTIDPAHQWQAMGYDYLIDERGCQLKPLLRGRGYEPLHRRRPRP